MSATLGTRSFTSLRCNCGGTKMSVGVLYVPQSAVRMLALRLLTAPISDFFNGSARWTAFRDFLPLALHPKSAAASRSPQAVPAVSLAVWTVVVEWAKNRSKNSTPRHHTHTVHSPSNLPTEPISPSRRLNNVG